MSKEIVALARTIATRSTANLEVLFTEGRSPATIRAYQADMADFARFVGSPDAIKVLISSDAGSGNEIALRYRNNLLSRGLKPASVNRRMATLRSVVAFARTLGFVDWQIAIKGVKSQPYRDTRGCGTDGVRKMLTTLARRGDVKAVRDTALVRLMFDLALRCSEVVSLDLEHLVFAEICIHTLRKGRTERERLTLPEPTIKALRAWVDARGIDAGPLFTNLDRAGKGHRLTTNGVYRLVRKLGVQIGRKVRPHGLRHAAVTEALNLSGGDVRSVAKFSSHRSIQTVLIYDDARTDTAGEIARLVAESI
jgi:integrase/recombinase XerC